jgi:hypothetical protein
MLTKTIDQIVAAYPWPPLGHEANLRQLLGFIAADDSLKDQRWVAYLLATTRHETGYTFAPVEEVGHGSGKPYGTPDPITGKVYYGRGYVQITWKGNYQKFSTLVGEDLVNHPEYALNPSIAYKIAAYGMVHGTFTGVGFGRYIHDTTCDYIDARRIINGLDCADAIAGYAKAFERSLS